jgi:hypothetical protein
MQKLPKHSVCFLKLLKWKNALLNGGDITDEQRFVTNCCGQKFI